MKGPRRERHRMAGQIVHGTSTTREHLRLHERFEQLGDIASALTRSTDTAGRQRDQPDELEGCRQLTARLVAHRGPKGRLLGDAGPAYAGAATPIARGPA